LRRYAAACCVIAVALATASFAAIAARTVPTAPIVHSARPHFSNARHLPYPRLAWPLQVSGSQYVPVAWADIAGWREDEEAFRRLRAPYLLYR